MFIGDSKKFIHGSDSKFLKNIREIVLGVEDGIVSTMGALTGIAVAVGDQFVVIVSGVVIIAVESISMGMGAYLSGKSAREIDERMIAEERMEVAESMEIEKEELREMYYQDGWPKDLADKMVAAASQDEELMLREMRYRELGLLPGKSGDSFVAGLIMFGSYAIGGLIPLLGYVIFSIPKGIVCSVVFAAMGLFVLGVVVSRYSKIAWWKVGARVLILGGISALVGFLIGTVAGVIK